MNYFDPEDAAKRYSIGRPYFHQNTIRKVKEQLQIDQLLDKGLDVACGTGLSTKALTEIVSIVHGTDLSDEMLKNAIKDEKIIYQKAIAESQPFLNEFFEIITVCSGIHWFDIDKFLNEAYRLLKSNYWLVVYDNFFISEMENTPLFNNWYQDVYQQKFPAPKRNNTYDWSRQNMMNKGFANYYEQNFKNPISFTRKDLVLYFTTQSNITNVVESKKEDYSTIELWLDEELSKFYSDDDEVKTIYFGNWVKYLQKK